MTAPQIRWQLDIVANTERMVSAAMHQLNDANEARWLVHRVMHHTMTDMHSPADQRQLDSALDDALRAHAGHVA